MKKLLIVIVFLIMYQVSTYANSVQVFTANTMHMKLTNDTKFEQVFLGDMETYIKSKNTVLSSKNLKEATATATLATVAGATARGLPNKIDLRGGLIGAAAVGGVLAVKSVYTSITEDNKYLFITVAVNPNKEKTLIYSYVISNYALDLKEVKKLAMNKIKESL